MPRQDVPRLALILGGSGLIPFLWFGSQHAPNSKRQVPWGDELIARWTRATSLPLDWAKSGDQRTVRHHLIAYGSCILSFLGAIHWGVAMVAPVPGIAGMQYAVSVLPALIGWGALVVDKKADHSTVAPHVMLITGFLGQYAFDEWALGRRVVPAWFTHLRSPLTVAVVSMLSISGYLGREPSKAEQLRTG